MIICVTRNNLELTKKCIPTLLDQESEPPVLVFDNASTDGTVQWLRTVRGIHTTFASKQVSLAAAWNSALRSAWAMGWSHALVVNNDVELGNTTYDRLLAGLIYRLPNRAICTGVSVREWSEKQYLEDGGEPLNMQARPHPDFSCFMLTRHAFGRVGPFDERFEGAYCEDNDYHVRVVKAGMEAVCIDVPFLHHGAQTVKRADADEREIIMRRADENRRKFWEKWGCWPGSKEYEELFK